MRLWEITQGLGDDDPCLRQALVFYHVVALPTILVSVSSLLMAAEEANGRLGVGLED